MSETNATPSLRHANRVADRHDAEVHGSKGEKGGANAPARRGEEAAAARDVERDPEAHEDNENLAGEERWVAERTREPLLPRRQKAAGPTAISNWPTTLSTNRPSSSQRAAA
jgi:hypothetical protein